MNGSGWLGVLARDLSDAPACQTGRLCDLRVCPPIRECFLHGPVSGVARLFATSRGTSVCLLVAAEFAGGHFHSGRSGLCIDPPGRQSTHQLVPLMTLSLGSLGWGSISALMRPQPRQQLGTWVTVSLNLAMQ